MSEIITFRPRARTATDDVVRIDQRDVRASLEEAVQAALDTADRLIAVLDGMDGDTDREDGADAEPSLAAPDGHESQVVWLRGTDNDAEAEAPGVEIPELQIAVGAPLPWSGRGNLFTAIGCAVMSLAGGP